MPTGVVRFDDDKLCLAGWASLGGSDPIRIKTPSDLSSGDAWIVDASYPAYRNAELFKYPFLKRPDFLRIRPSALANEIGLAADSVDALSAMSELYSRAAMCLNKWLDVDVLESTSTVAHHIKGLWVPPKSSVESKYRSELSEALIGATQEVQGGAGRAASGSVPRAMAFPRNAYARHLLSLPIPEPKAWRRIKVKGGPKRIGVHKGRRVRGGDSWLEQLSTNTGDLAIYLQVNVLEMSVSRSKFGAFSKGARHVRRWACAPEILAMADHAYMEVSDGFGCEFGDSGLPSIPLDPTFSGGLASENIWAGLCAPLQPQDGTARGAYIRMYDRMECLGAANDLAAAGYPIGSSGTGRVVVYTSPVDTRLNELALDSGLLPTPDKGYSK